MKYFIKICCFIFLVSSFVHSNEKMTNVSKFFNVEEMKVSILVDVKHGRGISVLFGDKTKAAAERKCVLEYAAKNNVITIGTHSEKPDAFITEKKKMYIQRKLFNITYIDKDEI